MLVRNLFVPSSCPQGGRVTTYVLWPESRKVIIRITKPECFTVEEIFNAELEQGTGEDELVFSRFGVNGYLGVVFRAPVLDKASDTMQLTYAVEAEDGLGEVHTKRVNLIGSPVHGPRLAGDSPGPALSATGGARVHNERDLVSAAIERIYRTMGVIDAELREEFRIEGRQMTISCSERIQRYDMVLIPEKTYLLPKTVKYTHVVPLRVAIARLPKLVPVPEAVVTADSAYKIKLNRLVPGERYLFSLEYALDNPEFLDLIVERSHCNTLSTGPDGARSLYEFGVLLKYPGLLKHNDASLVFRDIEAGVEIDIRRDIPARSHLQSCERTIARDLQELCADPRFRCSIEVRGDFVYAGCRRSADPLPEFVHVVLRTDLSPGKPAAAGTLSYKRRHLRSEDR
ncbi:MULTISPECIES: hypothetical protein [unclassified Methanoculleus]|jgi:hypothetical protein|uniref:hypothetical protein n=3 Tax=Methanoculleus TaxID=45989 RepID=UPI0025D62FF6|nr:hypothetical protein [Methanoculleus sp. UBA377]